MANYRPTIDLLENLFSNLTISQADANSQNYAVLKPSNEKLAVRRFSDGLGDSRLSTIIAARNYEYLKDVIQAAKDEEISTGSGPHGESIVQFSRRGRGKFQPNFQTRQSNRECGYRGYHHQYVSSFRGGNNNNYRQKNLATYNNVNRGRGMQFEIEKEN